jgi:hypothetical protein
LGLAGSGGRSGSIAAQRALGTRALAIQSQRTHPDFVRRSKLPQCPWNGLKSRVRPDLGGAIVNGTAKAVVIHLQMPAIAAVVDQR